MTGDLRVSVLWVREQSRFPLFIHGSTGVTLNLKFGAKHNQHSLWIWNLMHSIISIHSQSEIWAKHHQYSLSIWNMRQSIISILTLDLKFGATHQCSLLIWNLGQNINILTQLWMCWLITKAVYLINIADNYKWLNLDWTRRNPNMQLSLNLNCLPATSQ